MRAEQTLINIKPVLLDFDFSKIKIVEPDSNSVEEKKHVRSDKGLYKVFLLSFYFLFIFSINSIGRNIFSDGNNCMSQFTFLAEICDNGIDDDGDGFVDCADPDCTSCFEPDLCWIIADGNSDSGTDQDGLYSLNHVTGALTFIGATGTYGIEAMAIDPLNEVIYAMDKDLLGIINPATGTFTAIGSEIGNAEGSVGTINISDVDGLTYDITNNILWGTERRDEGSDYLPDDLLIQIDPATGQLIQNAFGLGIDYLVINTPENDLDDIAMADDGTLYGISNQAGTGNQRLGTINPVTGAWNDIGDYGISDVEGLGITSTGQLIATTGKDGSHNNNFYSIDPVSAIATFISSLAPGEDIEACACRSGNFVNSIIKGKVWSDTDADGFQDGTETGLAGITLNLLNNDLTPVLDDLLSPISVITDGTGNYAFDKLDAGTYRVQVLLPAGKSVASMNIGADDTLDSDFDDAGLTSSLTLVVGQMTSNVDAGLISVEICNNNMDDDGDGLTDCDDAECGCPEICGNGIDDNGNGLVDDQDPQCSYECLTDSEGCYTVDLISMVTNPDNSTSYTFDITNNCDKALSHARFKVDDLANIASPPNSGSYNGVHNNFQIVHSIDNPFDAIVFNTVGEGIRDGSTETFTYTIAPNATLLDTIFIQAKASGIIEILQIIPNGCVEICDNGVDDDFDGLADCDDPDCGGIPTVVTSGDLTLCSGTTTTITAIASGGVPPYSYKWNQSLGDGQSHSITPTLNKTYRVTVTGSNGCTATDLVSITVIPKPTADAGTDQTICTTEDFTLTGNASGGTEPYTFSWDQGLGNGQSHVVSPTSATTYTLTVSSPNGCNDTDQITLTPEPCVEDCGNGIDDDADGLVDCADPDCGPTASAGNDVSICIGESTVLSATASDGDGIYTYDWGVVLGAGQNKTVSPVVTTTYVVTVTAGSGCTGTDEVVVTVINCPENCTDGIDNDGDGLVDCDDPDCILSAAPNLLDDVYTTCPGIPYSDRVTYNDGNLQSPVFSIAVSPSNGTVTIDATGKFTYTPGSLDCLTDQFDYEVCNSTTGCCAQATVTIMIGDSNPPTLTNVPADITIGCDDVIPTAPTIIAFDECPGIFIDFDETSSQNYVGACESYTITRTWTATDLCGNSISDSQIISVLDLTKPEIFQVYTLENGKKVVAGIARRVTQDWKYVPFPITFGETPMVFSTVITENEMSAVTVRQKNPYSQGFEIRLFEEENNDGIHAVEDVAWIAVEPGTNLGDLVLEAGRWQNIGSGWEASNFTGYFGANPGLITTMQSTNDAEPSTVRINALGDGTVNVQVQEEQSADAETTHALEHIGYLAFIPEANLTDKNGVAFGETGKLSLSNAWTTVTLENSYTKPVVVLGGVSSNDTDGVNVRIRNLTSNSFEVRLQEWDYLDGNHGSETVSWIAMEGAIPGNMSYYCSGGATDLQIGNNIFAIDNCDDQIAFGYNEMPAVVGNGMLTTRTWMAIDDCGNTNLITRYDTCTTAALTVKAILHGAFVNNGNSGKMRDDLRKESFVPLEEPFSDLPAFPHVTDTTPHDPTQGGGNNGNNGNGGNNAPEIPPGAQAATYRTIADGLWTDPATWEGGNTPPTFNITNKKVSIEHLVEYSSGNFNLKGGSELYITNGGLKINNGNVYVQNADLFINNSRFEVANGNFDLWSGAAKFEVINAELIFSQNFINWTANQSLMNSCMTIYGDFFTESTDSLINSNIVCHSNFDISSWGKVVVNNSNINVKNGTFKNLGTVEGSDLTVWIENGNFENAGTWTSNILQYCVSSSSTGFGAYLPLAEDCSGLLDVFNNCDPLIAPDIVEPDDPNQGLTTAEIALPGTLEPTLLTLEGDDAVIDWLLLEIRDPADETNILDYATVALKANGNIVNEDGGDVISFSKIIEGDYFVTIRHRNHIPLMTDEPVFLSILNPPVIDFTDPSLAVRGDGAGGRIQNGLRTMWGGDYNEDGKVIYQGPNNDVFYLFSRALSDPGNTDYLANFIARGYDLHDFNLDGNVIYQGPNNDRASLLYNSVLSHTGNNGFLANFIVQSFMP